MENIKFAISHTKLQERGLSFESLSDIYLYVKSLVEYLESHNKNYTREQYYRIQTLQDIIESVDFEI